MLIERLFSPDEGPNEEFHWMAPAFDNGAKICYDCPIVITLSVHFSQKGGAYVASLSNLSRLQGSAACYCLYTPLFEDA